MTSIVTTLDSTAVKVYHLSTLIRSQSNASLTMKMIKEIGLCERVRSWIAILTGIVPPFRALFSALGVAYALIRLAYLNKFCTDRGIPGSIWMILKR